MILLSFGSVRHITHWHSTREKKIAESSAEAEPYALSTSFKTARNFRLMIHEAIATEVIMNMRCDNIAALAMTDEPSWRTRYLSIYGESLRQEVLKKHVFITYVHQDRCSPPSFVRIHNLQLHHHFVIARGGR